MGIDVTTRVSDGGNGFKPIGEGDKPRIAYEKNGEWVEFAVTKTDNGYVLDDLSTEEVEKYKVFHFERRTGFISQDEYFDKNNSEWQSGKLFIDFDGDGVMQRGSEGDDRVFYTPAQGYFRELERVTTYDYDVFDELERESYQTYNEMLDYYEKLEGEKLNDYHNRLYEKGLEIGDENWRDAQGKPIEYYQSIPPDQKAELFKSTFGVEPSQDCPCGGDPMRIYDPSGNGDGRDLIQ